MFQHKFFTKALKWSQDLKQIGDMLSGDLQSHKQYNK